MKERGWSGGYLTATLSTGFSQSSIVRVRRFTWKHESSQARIFYGSEVFEQFSYVDVATPTNKKPGTSTLVEIQGLNEV